MVERMLEIELSKEQFPMDQIDQLLVHETICKFCSSKESAEWILHKLYINHKEFGDEFDDELSVSMSDSNNYRQNNNDDDNNDTGDENIDVDDENNDVADKNYDTDEENNEHDRSNQQTNDQDGSDQHG